MPRVTLKSSAFLSIQEAKALPDRQRDYSLAILDKANRVKQFIPIKHFSQSDRIRRPNPVYYPLAVEMDLLPGTYALFGGKKVKFFMVGENNITEIPSPSRAVL